MSCHPRAIREGLALTMCPGGEEVKSCGYPSLIGMWVQMRSVARKLLTGKKSKYTGAENKHSFKPGDSSARPTTRSKEHTREDPVNSPTDRDLFSSNKRGRK